MIEMRKKRTEVGRRIERALRQAIAYERGELTDVRVTRHPITAREARVAPPPEYTAEQVRDVRHRMGLSQAVFARALNVSDSTVQAWEQGKRSPDGASLRLLELADRRPASFLRVLGTRSRERTAAARE